MVVPQSSIALLDLDYYQTKLFLLSLVWRASVARDSTFAAAALGPHEEPIRQMLHGSDPGPQSRYRINAGLIVDPTTRELWDQVLLLPLKFRARGVWAYRIVFGGVSWTVSISTDHPLFPPESSLQASGRLIMPVATWPDFARNSGIVEGIRNLHWPMHA